uniref:4-coumarate--CoA ligase n=1 Tax=Panagrolaimus sp. JU765 TaxID=591449 RepID=A0AC34R6G4_9BILA
MPKIDVSNPSKSLTFGDVLLQSYAIASFLHQNKFHHGTVVAAVLPNISEYSPICLGVTSIGGVLSPLSAVFTSHEMSAQFNDSKASAVFTIDTILDEVLKAVKENPSIKTVIVIREGKSITELPKKFDKVKIVDFEDVLKTYPDPDHNVVDINDERDLFVLPYSSGTSGTPKGVMLTHKSISISTTNWTNHIFTDVGLVADPPLQPGVTPSFTFTPFYHILGLSNMITAMDTGATLLTMPKFDFELCCQTIEKYKIRFLIVVPPLLVQFAKNPIVVKYDLSSLEVILCGAAPCGLELANLVLKRLPNIKFLKQGYGMTETAMIASTSSSKQSTKFESCGRLFPGFEMKIVDPITKKELDYNETGEIWLKSEQNMIGYLNRPQATAEALDDEGWLHTGDIGYIDKSTELSYVVDRLKELIKVNGFQVAPGELESLLLKHPKIKDAAVIGVKDDAKGEVPKAFVVKEGDLTAEEVQEFIADKVAKYKKLSGGVVFVNQIPKSPSGKILKRILKEQIN